MRLTWKDAAATLFMAVNALVYAAFLRGTDLPVISGVRGATTVVLILGIVGGCALGQAGEGYGAASSLAERTYTAVMGTLGIAAVAAAVAGLFSGSELALGILFTATLVLWLFATARHALAMVGDHHGTHRPSTIH